MADKVIAMEASNLFSLGANFHAQDSSSPHSRDQSNMADAAGNVQCETMINNMTSYSNNWAYCNATPAIGTDLGEILTAFGTVLDSKQPTGLTINFAAGEYATGSIEGHNHDDNAHATTGCGVSNVSAAVPASAGFGVPTFGVTMGDNATPISASINISCTHTDVPDADGEHWVGVNTRFTATMSLEIQGIPTTATAAALEGVMTGWTIDTNGPGDGNSAFDTFSITAHRYFDKAV